MLSIKFIILLIIIALLGALLVIFNDRIIPQNLNTQANTTVVVEEDQIEPGTGDEGGPIPTTEPTGFQVESQQDGAALLKSRCSQCHVIQRLEQFKKSRSGWELALKQMEALGVRLNDEEKGVLLDYLLSGTNP